MVVMATAGLYETSGEWLYTIGLPGKSGIGGGIVSGLTWQRRAGYVRTTARRGRQQRRASSAQPFFAPAGPGPVRVRPIDEVPIPSNTAKPDETVRAGQLLTADSSSVLAAVDERNPA